MDRAELRALQAPLKDQYRDDPASALTPISATGAWGERDLTYEVGQYDGIARAGLHAATGGDGSDACSGDMLLEALLGCAGVTLRSVATSMGLDVRSATGRAEGTFDARGTLALDRSVPVGVQDVVVTFTLETDADDETLARLAAATERYCVVGASLREPPRIVVTRPLSRDC